MRRIDNHAITLEDRKIEIIAVDERHPNKGNNHYIVKHEGKVLTEIKFQSGPFKQDGINGATMESIIAILIDRIDGFQLGEFKCEANEQTKLSLQSALNWLHKRTFDRIRRSIRDTHKR